MYSVFVLLSGEVKRDQTPCFHHAHKPFSLPQSPMPSILPSHIVTAIDSMFGPNRNELDGRMVKHIHKVQVHALLAMLDEVPRNLSISTRLNIWSSASVAQSWPPNYRLGISGTLLLLTTWAERT
jgi:hypothetical protein